MAIDVLVVDEDEDVLDVTEAFLGREDGLAVATETDPERALERVTGEAFGAVVSDLTMPGLDGLTLCRRLRETGWDGPFLLFTGRDERELGDGADCVTAVVRKGTGTGQYERIAEYVRDAAE